MPKLFSVPIFLKEFRRSVPSLILWCLISGGLLVLALFSFGQVVQTDFPQRLEEVLSAFPEEVLEAFHLHRLPEFAEFFTYFASICHSIFVIGCLYACYRGCRAMVKLESHQSIVLIYAQPISRASILLSSFASQALVLFIYNLVLWGASYSMSVFQLTGNDSGFSGVSLLLYFAYWLVQIMYLSIGYLISVFLSHSSQASAAAFAVLLVSLLLGIAGGAVPSLSWMMFLSPFYYLDTSALLQAAAGGASYSLGIPITVSLVFTVLFGGLAAVRYYFKDFNV